MIRPGRRITRPPTIAAVTYTGPGDIVSGSVVWWGLRAYNAAAVGTNCVKLRESGGNTTQIFSTIAGGGLDLAAISTFKGAQNLFVDTLYDQSGAGLHASQATQANQPAFILSGLGSLPVIRFTGVTGCALITASASTHAQPNTFSAVAKRTSGFTAFGMYYSDGADDVFIGFDNSANGLAIFETTHASLASVTDNQFHAVQSLGNSTSSTWNVDASESGVTVDGGATSRTGTHQIGNNGFASGLAGDLTELGIWNSALNSTQRTNIGSNQRTYWGF